MFGLLHVAFLYQHALYLLHGILVPLGGLLVVHDGGGVVNTDHTARLLLDL